MSPSQHKRSAGTCRVLAGVATAAAAAAGLVASAHAASGPSTVPIKPNPKVKKAGAISGVLTPAFAGFSVEPSNVFAYTGTDAPNALTNQLFENLRAFTGELPHLRVGGDTGDNMIWNATATAPALVDNPGTSNATDKWFVGPGLLTALDNLPAGTPVTLGLNLAYNGDDAIQRNIDEVKAALTTPKNVSVVSFEIGNEPDRYTAKGYRPHGWVEDPGYGPEWLYRVQQINKYVLIPSNLTKTAFEPGTVANPYSKSGTPFRIHWIAFDSQGTGANGLDYISGFNEHMDVYPDEVTQDWLLNQNNTYDTFTGWANEARAAVERKKPFNLREVMSVGPDGAWGISDSFANTLWTFNFFLHAAASQVSSINLHMTQTGSSAPWQPITIDGHGDAHVRSPYYAYAAIDQIIGGACNVRIAQDIVDDRYVHAGSVGEDAGNSRQAAYTIYSNDAISGFAFVNSQQSNATAPRNKFVNYEFTLEQLANQKLYLSYLSAPGTDSVDNTTWNGIQYNPTTGAREAAPALDASWVDSVTADGQGFVSVPVPDGAAVVANLGARLGEHSNISSDACAPYKVFIHDQVQTAPSARLLASSALVAAASTVAAAALLL